MFDLKASKVGQAENPEEYILFLTMKEFIRFCAISEPYECILGSRHPNINFTIEPGRFSETEAKYRLTFGPHQVHIIQLNGWEPSRFSVWISIHIEYANCFRVTIYILLTSPD